MPLYLPDGEDSGEYLIVRGADDPAYKKEKQISNLKYLDFAKKQKGSKEEKTDKITKGIQEFQEKMEFNLICKLVLGWSFDEEFSEEAVTKFLADAPGVATQVDQFAAERSNFFKKPSKNSEGSQDGTSN